MSSNRCAYAARSALVTSAYTVAGCVQPRLGGWLRQGLSGAFMRFDENDWLTSSSQRWELKPISASRTRVTCTYDWTQLTDQERLPRARATTSAQALGFARPAHGSGRI